MSSSDQVFTAARKRLVLAEYEAAPRGTKGAVLRRHGLHHSVITRWSVQDEAGVLEEGTLRVVRNEERRQIAALEAENAKLRQEIEKANRGRVVAEAAAEALGKASTLLQMMLQEQPASDGPDHPRGTSGRS